MVDFIYNLQFKIGCNKVCSAWNKIVILVMELIYPLYCKINVLTDKDILSGDTDVIISLTSFPERIPHLDVCIESLLRQRAKPGKIILWLAQEQFPTKEIPNKLTRLMKYGLEINFCEEDLKPHKKWFYTAKEYPNSIIITVDDDVIYSETLVERLLHAYEKYPKAVCCNMAHKITVDKSGDIMSYDEWIGGAIGFQGPSMLLVPIGVGGVLYPPDCFDERFFDLEEIKNNYLSTDDLWLKFNEVRRGITVYKISKHAKIPFTIRSSQEQALTKENNGASRRNDINIKMLQRLFNIKWSQIQ